MKVSGFTFIRNAILYDYPIVEAITSILPICDEFIVAIGHSDDQTTELINSIQSPKIKIIPTVWDDTLRAGGRVLAVETDKAFAAIASDSDWCFYIQGDECVHEKYLPIIKEAMELNLPNKKVEGLLFNYLHFYGSYDFIGTARKWYRNEIRIIRNNKNISSFRDAQGFRIDNRKLNVKKIAAAVYHYGWVKHPEKQQAKAETFNKLWHSDQWVEKNIPKVSGFDYSNVDGLKRFTESHPAVMKNRIAAINWEFAVDPTIKKMKLKHQLAGYIENLTGWRIGEYKNYRIIK